MWLTVFDFEREATECRRVAAGFRKMAERSWLRANQEFYLNMERRWLSLAQKFEWQFRRAKGTLNSIT
jgi:hypothetical protein